VKCGAFVNDKHYAVPVRAELPEAFWVAFAARLPPSALRASSPA